ncbi:GTPase activator activity protein [Tritrichomonas musculus]|uniref:GTPase activator activity protein n=1 Tax=Tritrichomonas musculus TaxID=1915356 RepID=A0ABR2GSJ9_9EUKA
MEEEEENVETKQVNEFVDGSDLNMFSKSTKSFMLKNIFSGVIQLDLSSNHMDEECSKILADHLSSPNCTLRSLSIVFCHLTHKCSSIIFDSIGNSPLYEFYADNNIISIENCHALSNSLSKDPPLELLSLVGCQINSDGFLKLFTGLPKSTHLHHLRFDSNSMYDTGATAFADLIPILNLQSLGISDNEIWRDGTTAIIQSCIQRDTIYSLDIGYNIVDLNELSEYVHKSQTLRYLSVSGIKIYEEQLNNFLNTIGNESRITRLLMEGINFHYMPISWGSAPENIFSNQSHMEALLSMIKNNKNLEDLRIGFLDLDQLQLLYDSCNRDKQDGLDTWHFILSLHNFGKTRNTWLITFPDFIIESPVSEFNWKSRIFSGLNASSSSGSLIGTSGTASTGMISMLAHIINNARFNGNRLKTIKFNDGAKMNDDSFGKFFAELLPLSYDELDLSNTELRNGSIDAIIEFLKKDGAYIERLHLKNTKASPTAFQNLFQFFNEKPEKTPKVLTFRFECAKPREELSVLDFTAEIGKLLGVDPILEELRFGGQITGKDANNIIANLKTNHHLRHLEMQSDLFERYHSADPDIDDFVSNEFNIFVETFLNDLIDEETQCILEEFTFPFLTELFLGYIPNIKLWPTIVKQLEANYNTNNDIQGPI